MILYSGVRLRPEELPMGWNGCPVIRDSSHLPLYLAHLVHFTMIYTCLQVFSLVCLYFFYVLYLSVSEKKKVSDKRPVFYCS